MVTTTFPISVLSLLNIPVARDICNVPKLIHSNIMYPTVPLMIVGGISMVARLYKGIYPVLISAVRVGCLGRWRHFPMLHYKNFTMRNCGGRPGGPRICRTRYFCICTCIYRIQSHCTRIFLIRTRQLACAT